MSNISSFIKHSASDAYEERRKKEYRLEDKISSERKKCIKLTSVMATTASLTVGKMMGGCSKPNMKWHQITMAVNRILKGSQILFWINWQSYT